jgi:hypothetical protein
MVQIIGLETLDASTFHSLLNGVATILFLYMIRFEPMASV